MVKPYEKKSSRGESMASALENVKEGRMSCLAAANAFNVPEATLSRRLKTMKILFLASSTDNADESGLSTVPNKLPMPMVISPTGSRRVSKIVSVERGRNVTIICCISATGFYLPPFLIFARKRILPELVGKAPPGQTITDKNIDELLSTAHFKAATVGNAVKGFKECGIEPHNPLVFSEQYFAAAKTTGHDVVGDTTENNSANPQTLVVENQHINPPEKPELIANADSDAPKKPDSVFF
ncbi:uncharacterized protein TNCV_101071 [Trichonephila clavipes]|nr:uncharacterized protein TNCV_101071 [Trichonephila clavipes]